MSVTGIVIHAEIGTTEDFVDLVSTFLTIASDFERQKLIAYFRGIASGLKPDTVHESTTEQAAPVAKETNP